ncbi:MAG: hypothetical protein ACJ71W_21695 [Terriglobales bacterium]
MPLTVISFTPYLSGNSGLRRINDEWDAFKFIQALKGNIINGYATVPVLGHRYRLDSTNAERTLKWFGRMASTYILRKELDAPIILIPVPNSSCCTQNDEVPRTVALAEAITGEQTHTSVLDCLRWTRQMESASKEGGTRDPQELYDNLVLTSRIREKGTYVLIDDMKTTGGHLQAARFMLLEQETECDWAICGGRTVWDHQQSPFTLAEEELDDWSPHPTLY